jgi:hypothetical protein
MMSPNNIDLHIATPCSAGWESMSAVKDGKYCTLCTKTVIDFSKMSVEEIKCYFKVNAGKEICGHFYKNQLENTHTLYQDNLLAAYRKVKHSVKNNALRLSVMMVLGLMLTLSGCTSHKEEEQVDGMIGPPPIDTTYNPNDTTRNH